MNDKAFLLSRGWVEATERTGPWRWRTPKRFGKPVSYYTLKDAVSLELSMAKVPKVAHGLQR